jgi:hypothetical protein
MTSRPDELEQFKLEIDLRLFAVDFGYQLDERASSPSGAVMRGGDGSKIRITRACRRFCVSVRPSHVAGHLNIVQAGEPVKRSRSPEANANES